MTTGQRGLGGAALIRRQLLVGRGQAVTLGVVTVIVVALLAAAPAVFALTAAAELRRAVTELSPGDRNLINVSLGYPPIGPHNDPRAGLTPELSLVWGALTGALAAAEQDLPAPLDAAVGDGRFVIDSGSSPVAGSPDVVGVQELALLTDPWMAGQLRLVQGSWPGAVPADGPVPVLLSDTTAAGMGWAVGEHRALTIAGQPELAAVLSGTFAPADPGADYWTMNRSVLDPEIFDDGNSPRRITGSGYVDPASWLRVRPLLHDPELRIWFPVSAPALAELPAEKSLAQLRQVLATAFPVDTAYPVDAASPNDGSAGTDGRVQTVRLRSELPDTMEQVAQRTAAASGVLALAVAGPCGAAVAVLGLGALLLAQRRRPALAMLASRGGSASQLRSLMTVDGALVCGPATVLGILLASVAVPGELPPVGIVTAVLAGAAPVAALAVSTSAATRLPGRNDGAARSPGRVRGAVELIILGLAAFSLFFVLRRGFEPTSGADPVLVATPVLLTLAACVLIGRVYSIPLGWLQRVLARGPGFVGYLGTVRALRGPADRVLPVLALVAGISMAVFSATMLGTLSAGIERAVLEIDLPGTTAADRAAAADRLGAAPIVTGLRLALLTGLVIVVLLCAAAVIMTTILNSSARGRLLAVLRALGATASQGRWLVGWEVLPMAVTTVLVGAGLGVLVSALVAGAVDLRPFTGGAEQPGLSVNPLVVAGLLAGFVAVLAGAITISAVAAQRRCTAATLVLDQD